MVSTRLNNRYLEQLHFPDDEPSGPRISKHEFDFERSALTSEELKEEILHEIEIYHKAPGVSGRWWVLVVTVVVGGCFGTTN